MTRSFPAAALVLVACMSGRLHGGAQPLSEVLAGVRAKNGLPAVAAVVFRGGSVLEEGVAGVRKEGDPTPATLDDKFHIGSVTKSMTATLAAMLVREGSLRWDATTADVLGPAIPDLHPGFRAVSLRQWLQHRGGAPHDPPGALWTELWARGTQPAMDNREWFVAAILRNPPAQPVGTFIYSNTGYMVAGRMIETTTRKPWEELLRQRLFEPLGMASAGFGPAAQPGPIAQTWGHVKGKPIAPGPQADNPPALGPAGTVHCSPRDLARYAAFHLREGKGQPALLTPADFAELHRAAPGDPSNPYALGWFRVPRPWAQGDALTHNGCNTMNHAVVWLAPAIDFGLVALTNEGGPQAGPALDQIASAMVAKYCPSPR